MINKVTLKYTPRPFQAWLHARLRRFNVLVCHRRFGKTIFAIHELLDRGIRNQKEIPQYAYLAPTYGSAKRVAWDALKKAVADFPGIRINESELKVEIPMGGSVKFIRIILLGAENPGALRGIYLDGIILDEFAEMDPTVWSLVVRPALSDRLGWAIFIGTPKGNNHFYEMYRVARKLFKEGEDWFAALFKASQTGVIPTSELMAAKQSMSEPEFNQEYECDFASMLSGAYFSTQLKTMEDHNRIRQVPWDQSLPVHTGWDLGMDDAMAIWFIQAVGTERRMIDYYEVNSTGFPEIVKHLKSKPYLYGTHFLPHDAAVRELGTGKSRRETLAALSNWKIQDIVIVPRHNVADGIEEVRKFLSYCWADEALCEDGITALKNYQKEYDTKTRTYSNKPLHDWSSHAADGLRTFAMGFRKEYHNNVNRREALVDHYETEYDMFGGN